MRYSLAFVALATMAIADPIPQNLDFAVVDSAPQATVSGPPVGAVSDDVKLDVPAAVAAASAAIEATPLKVKRTDVGTGLGVNDPCGPQPDG